MKAFIYFPEGFLFVGWFGSWQFIEMKLCKVGVAEFAFFSQRREI